MKKLTLPLAAIIGLTAVTSAHAQFGGMPKMGLPGAPGASQSSSQAPAVDIDTFLESANMAKALVAESVTRIAAAVVSKEEAQKINDRRVAANAMTDTKEKESALKQIASDEIAIIGAADADAVSKQLAAEKNQTKVKELGASIYNLALGLLKDKEAFDQGMALIKQIQSNPMNAVKMAPKIGRLKEVLSSIGSQVSAAPTLMKSMKALATVAKVSKFPTSSSEASKKSGDGL